MTRADIIINDAASLYGCDTEELTSSKRHRRFADARKVICYILCTLQGKTYSEVGRMLNRNHATVIYYEQKAGEWMRQPMLNTEGAERIKYIAKKHNIKL